MSSLSAWRNFYFITVSAAKSPVINILADPAWAHLRAEEMACESLPLMIGPSVAQSRAAEPGDLLITCLLYYSETLQLMNCMPLVSEDSHGIRYTDPTVSTSNVDRRYSHFNR